MYIVCVETWVNSGWGLNGDELARSSIVGGAQQKQYGRLRLIGLCSLTSVSVDLALYTQLQRHNVARIMSMHTFFTSCKLLIE